MTPSREHPVTRGNLCVKGWNSFEFILNKDRLRVPLIRKNGRLEKAEWDEALDLIAEKLARIKDKYGPDALAT